ncbi:hypothetical protein EDB80DRAFT_697063 [Ilyonectria destructans]|nr:hypothetical protein EDB80DRAFT_697063 [Ilyonectria destructans]
MPGPRRPSGPVSHLSHLRCCSLVLLMSKQVLSSGRAGRCRKDPARVMCVGESTGVVCPSQTEFVNFSSGLSPDPEAVEMAPAPAQRGMLGWDHAQLAIVRPRRQRPSRSLGCVGRHRCARDRSSQHPASLQPASKPWPWEYASSPAPTGPIDEEPPRTRVSNDCASPHDPVLFQRCGN